MGVWKTIPLEMPLDGSECWVRLNYWFGAPFKARWYLATEEWIDSVSGMNYPVWTISRWRYM